MQKARIDRKNPTTIMLLGLIFTVLTFASGSLAGWIATKVGVDRSFPCVITRSLLGIGFIVALGGREWLRFDLKAIRDSWSLTLPFVMINIILAALIMCLAASQILAGNYTAAEYFASAPFVALLCVFVGINEEAMFRGLAFGGLLAGIGQRKNGPLMAAILSSLAFGFIHVVFDLNFNNPLVILQGLLKTVECGMFGFVLCVSVLETRRLCGAMSVHGFFDWIVLVANGGSLPTAYVTNDEEGALAGIAFYLVLTVLYAPRTIKAYKRLKTVELPQYGPFVQGESAPLASTARHLATERQGQASEGGASVRIGRLRDHVLLNNKYLTIVGTFAIYLIGISFLAILSALFIPAGIMQTICLALMSIALAIVLAFWYQWHFAGTFEGMLGWSTTSLIFALPCSALCLWNVLDWGGASFNNPLVALLIALASVVSEEVLFRGIPGSNWMRLSGERSDILPCVIVCALASGLVHIINLFVGAAFSSTIYQIFYAFCLSVVFQAVFLRTGSLWGAVIVHTIIDAMSYLTADLGNAAITKELVLGPQLYLVCVTLVVLFVWGLYLIRPQKRDEIVALWKRKWHKAT